MLGDEDGGGLLLEQLMDAGQRAQGVHVNRRSERAAGSG